MNSEQKYDLLLERVYQAGLEPDGWDYFLRTYCDVFPHSKSSIASIETGTSVKKILSVRNYDPCALSDYNRHFADKNPFALDKLGRNPSNIYWGHDLISKEELFKTEFYQDFLRPHEDAWLGFGICVHETPTHKLYISNNTNGSYEADFLEQFRIISRLLPHIQRASEFQSQALRNKQLEQTFESFIDQFSCAVLILNTDLRVVRHNREAEHLLSESSTISIDLKKHFRFKTTQDSTAFLEQFTTLKDNDSRKSKALYFPVKGQKGRSQIAFLYPLFAAHGETTMFFRAEPPRQFALFISDPKRSVDTDAAQLARAMHLSPAEAALAHSLLNGQSLNNHAASRGISKHTARAQLKSVMSKTDSNLQSELTANLAKTFGMTRDSD